MLLFDYKFGVGVKDIILYVDIILLSFGKFYEIVKEIV